MNAYRNMSTTNWVMNYGTEYQILMFVLIRTDKEIPVFGKINNIIINEDQALILTCKVDTVYFDDPFNAFCRVFSVIYFDD